MTDPFTDVADELMTRTTDLGGDASIVPAAPTNPKTKKHVCPYCGAVTAVVEKPTGPCPRCNMEDTPATRAATKARIGPWHVLQTRNPSAPGMKWATLLSLVSKGQVTPRSVVRGPTTHQLWKFAAHVKGLSREFNLCYSCGGEIDRTANQCTHCDRLQEPPINPDSLLESREIAPRGTIQREIKPALGSPLASGPMSAGPTLVNPSNLMSPSSASIAQPQATDMVLAGGDDRRRSPDDGILSAKELAAAFQLDFNPNSQVDPMPEASPRTRRRPIKALATLVLLGAIGGGVLLYAKPEYREKSIAWVNSTYESVKSSLAAGKPAPKPMPWESTTPKSSEAEPVPSPQPAADVAIAPSPSPAPEINVDPVPAIPGSSPQGVTPQGDPPMQAEPPLEPTPASNIETPAPAPASVLRDTPSDSLAVAPAPTPAPLPTPAPEVVPPKPTPAAIAQVQIQEKLMAALDAPLPASRRDQEALAKLLWTGAIDKDREQDYPLSIKCYEKLKQLDPSLRQSNKMIDQRLEFAKEQLPK